MDGSGARPRPAPTRRHVADTVRLAAPLAAAQLAQMAMGITDTVLLGSLGADALAAGGLGTAVYFTTAIVLQGVLSAASVLVAAARGAGADARVPDLFRTALLLALLLALPAFALMSGAEPILRALGEPDALAADAGRFVRVLRWGAAGSLLGSGLMRAFLPAVGHGRLLLWAVLAAVGLNAALGWELIHGAWGLPRLGLLGPAAATVVVAWFVALALLACARLLPGLRRFVRGGRVRPRALAELLRIGVPVGGTYGVETGLFLATGLMAGLLGPDALAAHQIALSVASTAFMVPLALSQAANVRVGWWAGAGDPAEARRAGFVAIGLGAACMAASGCLMLLLPGPIVGLYLARQASGPAASLANTLLAVAALFAVADGVQTVAAGALRGLRDTRVPFLIAAAGYWGVGFPVGFLLAFPGGLGVVGLWLGLAAGLAVVAALLTLRFERRGRPVPA